MKKVFSVMLSMASGAAIVLGAMATGAYAGEGKVNQQGDVTSITLPSQASSAMGNTIDFQNAKPMPLPQANYLPMKPANGELPALNGGTPDFESGSRGNGLVSPEELPPQGKNSVSEEFSADDELAPSEYGTGGIPYSTMRVGSSGAAESKKYPQSAAGKLYFNIGADTYMCSASLIKRGIAVTAAHCVAEFGKSHFYSNWRFIPALYNTTMPYGQWNVSSATVMTSYYNGTETCYQYGVVCPNDVAVLEITPDSTGAYPGATTGWLGYGWNGYGFTPNNLALIHQLGYPKSHDKGLKMQRTDSQGYTNTTMSSNTVWGSRQTGGSSGGPEVVNLGWRAALVGTALGSEASTNIVVGVTSWGYIDDAVKLQGASPFTSGNITILIDAVCGNPVTDPRCL